MSPWGKKLLEQASFARDGTMLLSMPGADLDRIASFVPSLWVYLRALQTMSALDA